MKRKTLPKDAFFKKMTSLGFALTFEDVSLKTAYSQIMPDNVDLETRFSRNVPLKIPLTSAAMDTVTESALAIELAKLGGVGVLHRYLSPEEQARHVAKVKFHLNGLIERPICFGENDSIEYMLKVISEKNYNFHTFPIINDGGILVGIITGTDFNFCSDRKLKAKDVMTKKLLTAEKETNISGAFELMQKTKKKVLPLVDKNRKIIGMYVWSDVKRIVSGDSKPYNIDANGQLRVAAAVGTREDAESRLEQLIKEHVDLVVIDTAHGDSKHVIETLKWIKESYEVDVVVGNISRKESALRLIKAGADGIKVGQGSGSICTTRIIAGVGVPQLTAIYEVARVSDKYGIPVCADGGIRHSGDIVKAIGAGASSVMLGSLLAGTKEAPGRLEFVEGRQWKVYRGMGSIGAMEVSKEAKERYNQAITGKEQLIAEGVEGIVPYKGELKDVIFQYVGGLRRGMGYIGAADIDELRGKAEFIRVTVAGEKESHPQNIKITREPPNYSGK